MKERPILFSTPMVQAILEGRKTQTRRIIKSKHESGLFEISRTKGGQLTGITSLDWDERPKNDCTNDIQPICDIGGVLWVRETWKPGAWREDGRVAFDYKASPEITNSPWVYPEGFDDKYFEKWTDELLKNGSIPDQDGYHHWEPGKSPISWKPSIFMPKEACRIFLKVTNVRVERLNDISGADAFTEGVGYAFRSGAKNMTSVEIDYRAWETKQISLFKTLWESINGLGSWEKNPYVWVYEFERIEKPLINQ